MRVGVREERVDRRGGRVEPQLVRDRAVKVVAGDGRVVGGHRLEEVG